MLHLDLEAAPCLFTDTYFCDQAAIPQRAWLKQHKLALLKRAALSGLALPSVTVLVLLASSELLAGWLFYVPKWHQGVLKGT